MPCALQEKVFVYCNLVAAFSMVAATITMFVVPAKKRRGIKNAYVAPAFHFMNLVFSLALAAQCGV